MPALQSSWEDGIFHLGRYPRLLHPRDIDPRHPPFVLLVDQRDCERVLSLDGGIDRGGVGDRGCMAFVALVYGPGELFEGELSRLVLRYGYHWEVVKVIWGVVRTAGLFRGERHRHLIQSRRCRQFEVYRTAPHYPLWTDATFEFVLMVLHLAEKLRGWICVRGVMLTQVWREG